MRPWVRWRGNDRQEDPELARNHYVKAQSRFPTTPQELAECLADPVSAADVFGSSPQAWSDFATYYAQSSPQIGELAQLEAQKQLQAMGGRVKTDRADAAWMAGAGNITGHGKNRFYNKRAPGVSLDGVLPQSEWPMAQFVSAVNPRNEGMQPLRTQMANAMSERVPAEGGALVPEVLRSDLLMMVLEHSIVRQHAHIVPMDSLRVPFPMIDDVTHSGAASVFGGLTAYWTEEAAALTSSAPAFGRITLQAEKLTAYTDIPNELLQDAGPLLEDWIQSTWPTALAWFEDDAFINGTGVGEPQGLLLAPAAIRVPVTSVNKIYLADVITAYARILPQSLRSPGLCWLAAPDVKPQLQQMALTAQSATSNVQPVAPPAWFVSGNAISGTPDTLFGVPVCFSEKMPSCSSSNTTTPGGLTLVDLGFYLLGERSEMRIAVSEQYKFANDLTSYRIIERCTGRIWQQSALTPRNGGATLSPVVKIDTTATS